MLRFVPDVLLQGTMSLKSILLCAVWPCASMASLVHAVDSARAFVVLSALDSGSAALDSGSAASNGTHIEITSCGYLYASIFMIIGKLNSPSTRHCNRSRRLFCRVLGVALTDLCLPLPTADQLSTMVSLQRHRIRVPGLCFSNRIDPCAG